MKVVYAPEYNIDLGLLNRLHPFDGTKFRKVERGIRETPGVELIAPARPLDHATIEAFVDPLMKRLLRGKRYVLGALELPYLPLLPFSLIDRYVLSAMRWAAAGTIEASRLALRGTTCWNLGGGYHHASRNAAEGFCLYNDIGMAYDTLINSGELQPSDRVLIVDVDAHHGNGNARVFDENRNVVLLDVYNRDIYPSSRHTRSRVDLPVPLPSGSSGPHYLEKLEEALGHLARPFRLAFVVAGTDVLASDGLGHLSLTVEDCAVRDRMVMQRLRDLSTPAVVVAGGGYSAESSRAMIASINGLAADAHGR